MRDARRERFDPSERSMVRATRDSRQPPNRSQRIKMSDWHKACRRSIHMTYSQALLRTQCLRLRSYRLARSAITESYLKQTDVQIHSCRAILMLGSAYMFPMLRYVVVALCFTNRAVCHSLTTFLERRETQIGFLESKCDELTCQRWKQQVVQACESWRKF